MSKANIRRYQIVVPYTSDKIYEASSLKKGAKKCYREFKMNVARYPNSKSFTIMDIDNLNTYQFALNKYQIGGDGEDNVQNEENQNDHPVENLERVEDQAEHQEKTQIDRIEHKLDRLLKILDTKEHKFDNFEQMPQVGDVYEANMRRLNTIHTLQKDEIPNNDMCQLM